MSTDSTTDTEDVVRPGPHSGQERIVIAVLTYRRPTDLAELLPLLINQAHHARSADRRVEILVVDNDRTGTAEAVVERAADDARKRCVRLRYAHEPSPGISAARNRALDEAADDDVLIFIDDDERPGIDWSTQLLSARSRFSADVVQGPVESQFEVEPGQWLRACGFDFRRRLPTGTRLGVAVTNNLLLDLHVVRRSGIRFDPDLGTTGGEDTLFTGLLHRAGASMFWCAEAIVYDVVPAHRITRSWVQQRAISTGNAAAVVTLKLSADGLARKIARLRLTAGGLARIVGGGLRLTIGRTNSSGSTQGRATRTMLRGLGMALGAWGYGYQEYARDGARRLTRISSKVTVASALQVDRQIDHVS